MSEQYSFSPEKRMLVNYSDGDQTTCYCASSGSATLWIMWDSPSTFGFEFPTMHRSYPFRIKTHGWISVRTFIVEGLF